MFDLVNEILRGITRSILRMNSQQRFVLMMTSVVMVGGLVGTSLVVSTTGGDTSSLLPRVFGVVLASMTLTFATSIMLFYLRGGTKRSHLEGPLQSTTPHHDGDCDPANAEIQQAVAEHLKGISEDALLARLKEDVLRKLSWTKALEIIESRRIDARERLLDEIDAISRRGNLNLAVGCIISISGLFLLGYLLFSRNLPPDVSTALTTHTPRLAFIVLIQLFGFFFLRLYRSNVESIRYFHNEITNLDCQMGAVAAGIALSNEAMTQKGIDALARTERNFVLAKGQSTVLLELTRQYGGDLDGAALVASAIGSARHAAVDSQRKKKASTASRTNGT